MWWFLKTISTRTIYHNSCTPRKEFHHIKETVLSSLYNNWESQTTYMHRSILLADEDASKWNLFKNNSKDIFPKMTLNQTSETKWKNNSKDIFLDSTKILFR